MLSFTKLFILSAIAAVGFALTVRDVDHPRCSDAKLISSTTIHAGGHDIIKATHSCGPSSVERRQTDFIDVCGEICTTSCNNKTGILPPISQDCQTIVNAIAVMKFAMPPTFVVQPNHVETLSYGTCSYFFQNNGNTDIVSCWSDLSTWGGLAGAACFPPVQPFYPEGLCTAYDSSWAAGATHV